MVLPVLVVLALTGGLAQPVAAAPTDPGWVWPVTGPVIAPFDPPDSPYGSGHRGIDIAAPLGTPVLAPAAGHVTFAGPVGGRLYVTVDHGGGVLSTSSFLSSLAVRRNDAVEAGQTLGASGTGHAGALIAHVHFSVRLDTVYVDPLDHLAPLDLSAFIRLAATG
jgi:murein DD-endopeptidase MepM/ murein hydrolase activator NlpD